MFCFCFSLIKLMAIFPILSSAQVFNNTEPKQHLLVRCIIKSGMSVLGGSTKNEKMTKLHQKFYTKHE